MTDYYVDFDWGGATNGTQPEPYNDVQQLSLSDGDTVYIKRGGRSRDLTNTRWVISADVTVDAYGTGDKPIISSHLSSTSTGDWVEETTDVWVYTLPKTNNYDVIGFGWDSETFRPANVSKAEVDHWDVNSSAVNKVWSEYGEYAMDKDNSKLALYAPQNPVTEWGEIIIAERFWGALRVNYCDVVVQNIDFRTCGFGIDVGAYGSGDDPSVDAQNCEFFDCYRGIMLRGNYVQSVDTSVISNNYFEGCRSASVNLNGIVNGCTIESNIIRDNGRNYSLGAIYLGRMVANLGNEVVVRYNDIDGVYRGNYWPSDGDGIFMDGLDSCEYVHIYANTIRNVYGDGSGLKDNSAAKNSKVYSNIVDGAARGIQTSNSSETNSVDCEWFNNVCVNLSEYGLKTGRVKLGGTATFRNNIFVGTGAGGTYGHFSASTQEATMDENYNCFYNFETDQNFQALGANSITTDPLLENYKPTMGSPCVGVGDATVLPLNDYDGHAFVSPVNMGAYEGLDFVYYASQFGAGAQDGSTPDNAWAVGSIGTLKGSDTCYLLGTFGVSVSIPAHSGTSGNRVTYRGDYPGNICAIVNTSGTGLVMARDYTNIQSVIVSSLGSSGINSDASECSYIDCQSSGSSYGLLFTQNDTSNVTITGGQYTGGTDGIRLLAAREGDTYTNFEIAGTISKGTSGSGIRLTSNSSITTSTFSSFTITDNTLNDCGALGLRIGSTGVGVNIHDNYTIRSNVANGNASGGMTVRGATTVLVEDNQCNNNLGVNGGINVFDTDGATIRYNQCNSNDTSGIDGCGILMDENNLSGRVYGNECSGNDSNADGVRSGAGVKVLGGCIDTQVYGNWGTNNNVGLYVGGATHFALKLHNNTFTSCISQGVHIRSSAQVAGIELRNNILEGDGTGIETQPTGDADVDYNCFFGFSTLYTDQTAGANDITDHPMLINGKLPVDSPCANTGDTGVLPLTDYNGTAFDTPINMGAFADTTDAERAFSSVVTDIDNTVIQDIDLQVVA